MSFDLKHPPEPDSRLYAFIKESLITLEKQTAIMEVWLENLQKIQSLEPFTHTLQMIVVGAQTLHLENFTQCLDNMLHVITLMHQKKLLPDSQTFTFLLLSLDESILWLRQALEGKTNASNGELTQHYHLLIGSKNDIDERQTIETTIPIEIFYEEVEEIIDILEYEISILESDPNSNLDEIKRALHTLKGSSNLVGYKALGEFVHELEDKIDSQSQADNVHSMSSFIQYLRSHEQDILNKINLVPTWEMILAQPQTNYMSRQERGIAVHSPYESSERLRISLNDIESFGQLAATTNIKSAYISLQMKSIKHLTKSMSEAMDRLDEQAKAVQLQANTMVGSSALISTSEYDFDALEMDRYTQLQHHVQEIQDINASLFLLHDDITQEINHIEDSLREQSYAVKGLEEGLRHVRMVSFDMLIPRLSEIVNNLSTELKKEIDFKVIEAEGVLDRSVLERLMIPLEHMLRNAIDHGLETSAQRLSKGKPSRGSIAISMKRQGPHIIIMMRDDGCGLDLESIKERALLGKWWVKEREPTPDELIKFIFQPGFSTAQTKTIVSGRGIGMDVVHTEIKKMGGHLRVKTAKDVGTQFVIRLPFTSSLNKALILKIQGVLYGVLRSNLKAITRVSVAELKSLLHDGAVYRYMNQDYVLMDAGERLGLFSFEQQHLTKKYMPVLLMEIQETRLAFIVDHVVGTREILLKSLGPQMRHMPIFIGASVMGDGEIILMLDPFGLVDDSVDLSVHAERQESVGKKVLVIDDSITVRKVTSGLLRRHSFEVETAKDGMDAVEIMKQISPDCILLDLEMPRMDGFSFLKWLRSQPQYKKTPVIVISSRSLDKYKRQVYDLGADYFMSKPFQESELISFVDYLTGLKRDE